MVTYRTYQDPTDDLWWVEVKEGMCSGGYPTEREAVAQLPRLIEDHKRYEAYQRALQERLDASQWVDDPALD